MTEVVGALVSLLFCHTPRSFSLLMTHAARKRAFGPTARMNAGRLDCIRLVSVAELDGVFISVAK